ncbi:MAG TPA: CRISPR system precrRNA processing endoribonuclease RAMP protein Cas6, partial [Anaerolineae bacterium]|nr:CRISPR system precrRNA processing endoribonuclease RAMP protein Cas6 [Anaerolineae bacterium]
MLVSVVLQLQPDRPLRNPAGLGRAAHACFLGLVSRFDPALAQSLHRSEITPFALSILADPMSTRRGRLKNPPNSVWLRLTSLDERLSALLQKLEPKRIDTLRLLHAKCKVVSIISDSKTYTWARKSTFSEISNNGLVRARKGESYTGFRFLSLTSFSMAKSRLSMPLPWPRLVFQSLVRRWNAFSRITWRIDWPEFDRGVSIAEHRLQTCRLDLGRFSELGFVGECWYVIDRDVSIGLRHAIHALAEFAFFSGVGKKTTMGMGFVLPLTSGPLEAVFHGQG